MVSDRILEISDDVLRRAKMKDKCREIVGELEGVDLRGEFDQVVRRSLDDTARREIIIDYASDEQIEAIVKAWSE